MAGFTDKVRNRTESIRSFISRDIWILDFSAMGKWRKSISLHLQAIIICTRNFFRDRIGREAVALSFFSTMAAVPLLASIIFVSGGFGLEQMLETKLLSTFPGNVELINFILGIAHNMVDATENGTFGWISFLTFVWLVLWLMIQIGVAFNRVWHVKGQRKIITKVAVYFGLFICIPFVILLFLSGWAYYIRFFEILDGKLGAFHFITRNIFWLIFYGVASLALSVMYKFIPAHKVHYRAALKASFLVGVVFVAIQYLYMGTQVVVTRISGVYGVLAFVPLFMIWMNISWQTILYGATLSEAFHRIREWEIAEKRLEEEERKELALQQQKQQ